MLTPPRANPNPSRLSAKPIRVSLVASPPWTGDMLYVSQAPAAARARAFLKANPDAEFYWDAISHEDLKRLDRTRLLVGSTDHATGFTYDALTVADIPGPGPHGLIFNRFWMKVARSGPDNDPSLPHWPVDRNDPRCWPGALIAPNMTVDLLMPDGEPVFPPDVRDHLARELWAAWEEACATDLTANDLLAKRAAAALRQS